MTITTIAAQFSASARADGTIDSSGDGSDTLGVHVSLAIRHIASYNIAANVAVGQTASTIELDYTGIAGDAPSDSWYPGAYASDGNRDPSGDSGATLFSNADTSGAPYVTTTAFQSTGEKIIDITSAASLSHLQAAINAARTVHAIAIRQVDETGTSHRIELGEQTDSGPPDNRPKLRVTHFSAGVGSVPQSRKRKLFAQLMAG